jgi:hypothetical protein
MINLCGYMKQIGAGINGYAALRSGLDAKYEAEHHKAEVVIRDSAARGKKEPCRRSAVFPAWRA